MLVVLSFEVSYAFGFVFICCEVGERFSGSFNEICDIFDQFNWYLLPVKIQQMLPTVILIAQLPVVIECFGSILCLREAFKSVGLI